MLRLKDMRVGNTYNVGNNGDYYSVRCVEVLTSQETLRMFGGKGAARRVVRDDTGQEDVLFVAENSNHELYVASY